MKIKVERISNICETEVLIKCKEHADERTEDFIRKIQFYLQDTVGFKDGNAHKILLQEVFYIEYVDEKTFFYLEHEVYETRKKLYEWERQLTETSFVRISKSTILNIDKLKGVRSLLNGKMECTMINGEKQIVNRHYISRFREKFGI